MDVETGWFILLCKDISLILVLLSATNMLIRRNYIRLIKSIVLEVFYWPLHLKYCINQVDAQTELWRRFGINQSPFLLYPIEIMGGWFIRKWHYSSVRAPSWFLQYLNYINKNLVILRVVWLNNRIKKSGWNRNWKLELS